MPGTTNEFILEKYREDVGKAFNRITLFIASRNDFLMAELPTLDDDIEIDLDDNIDLEISGVFARMESTVHKKARPSDEMKTRVAQNGALFLDAETSEDKATVIDNPSPSNQDTDTVHTLNQDKFIGCAWQINYFTVHKKARPSDEMKTRVAQNGALFLDAETSEDKATVIDNPSPSNQDTDTVHTLNQDKFIGCAWQINYFTVIRVQQNVFQRLHEPFYRDLRASSHLFPKYSERLLLV